jgi:hypothetical protein
MEEKRQHITLGQRFRHRRKGTVYIVRDISDGNVVLVSENGENLLRIPLESLTSTSFELIYD